MPRASLDSHRILAGLPLVYEVNRRRTAFRFDGAFFARLESWAEGLVEVLPSRPKELWTYGSWTDGGSACDSWHNSGRAFDVARLPLVDGSVVSCRYDQWRTLGGARLDAARRRYWSLAAGLHLRFASVLTYLYNREHANHIHVDNGRSGNVDSTFSSRSQIQVQAVQALCSYSGAPRSSSPGPGTPPPGRRPARCSTGSGSTTPWTLGAAGPASWPPQRPGDATER